MNSYPRTLKEAKNLPELPEGSEFAMVCKPNGIMMFFDDQKNRWMVVINIKGKVFKSRGF